MSQQLEQEAGEGTRVDTPKAISDDSRTASENDPRVRHSPLPWHVDADIWLAEPDGRVVARTAGNGLNGIDAKANAAFIARACNAHYALVVALRELVRAWDATQFPVSDRIDAALTAADKALGSVAGVSNGDPL